MLGPRVFIAVVLLVGASTAAARAADMVTVPLGSGDAVPVTDTETDWSGFYAGVFGTARSSDATPTAFGAGVELGVDTPVSFALVGGSISVSGLTGSGGSAPYLDALTRLGVPLTDDFAVFATAGVEANLGTGDVNALIGAGAEFRLTDDVSLEARYLRGIGADPSNQFTLGTTFHF